jgi:hypothetical protein
MILVRKAADRGRFNFGWLDTRHTFSFGDYHDPDHMGFRQLRVINEDRVTPGRGFPTHSHRDMEILSYVLEGPLEHQDSMGHRETLRPGEVQRITAGRGVTQYNPRARSRCTSCSFASRDGRDGSLNGAAVSGEDAVGLKGGSAAEALVFDLS